MASLSASQHTLQCILLFDRRVDDLDAIVRDFARIEEMKTRAIFNVEEHKPDSLARLTNADEAISLTFESRTTPPDRARFQQALALPITAQLIPDAAALMAQTAATITLEVTPIETQIIGKENGTASSCETVVTLGQFHRRLDLLALMGRVVLDHAAPILVYWQQSERLLAPNQFDTLASQDIPSALHIQPIVYGPKRQALDPSPHLRGLSTMGAHPWLGGEVIVTPNNQDWQESYNAALAFIASAANDSASSLSYGNVFSPEGFDQRYRIDHPSVSDKGYPNDRRVAPLYELVLLDPPISLAAIEPQIGTPRPDKVHDTSEKPTTTPPGSQPMRKPDDLIPKPLLFGRRRV